MKFSEELIAASKLQIVVLSISSLAGCFGLFKSVKRLRGRFSKLDHFMPQTLNKQQGIKKINALIKKQSTNKEMIYLDKIVCSFSSFNSLIFRTEELNFLKISKQFSKFEPTFTGIYNFKNKQVFINIEVKEAYFGRQLVEYINQNNNKKLNLIEHKAALYGQLFYNNKNVLTFNTVVIGLNRKQILHFWAGEAPYDYGILVLSSISLGIALSIAMHQQFLQQLNLQKYFNLI